MPELSAARSTCYGKTQSGNERSWIPSKARVGTARISSPYDDRYRVVVTPDLSERYGDNNTLKLVGEIIASVYKETRRDFMPCTLSTLLRASEYIHQSNQDRIIVGLAQVDELLDAAAQMKAWLRQTPESLHLLTSRLMLMSGKLLRAHTSLRLRAGQKIGAYEDFLDSIDRRNPMISGQAFTIAARNISAQVEIDQNTAAATLRRIAVAKRWWDLALDEVHDLLGDAANGLSIEDELQHLRLKPFYFAVNYVESKSDGGKHPDLATAKAAFVAELMLLHVEMVMAELKHRPKRIEEIPFADFAAALPDLAFDGPYEHVAHTVAESYEQMAAAADNKDFVRVSNLAEEAQNKLRYRGGSSYSSVWHHTTLKLQPA